MNLKKIVPFGRKDVPARREEYDPFSLLRQEMNRLFDGFDRGFLTEPFEGRLDSFRPRVDVSETDKEIRIAAELPGMDEKDIEVSVNKDAVTIKGEKKEEKEDKGKAYYHMERSYGSFLRTRVLYRNRPVSFLSMKRGVLRYRSPPSGRITTTRPFFISPASLKAIAIAAPELIPTRRPSFLASILDVR